jgi:hypothetical protein
MTVRPPPDDSSNRPMRAEFAENGFLFNARPSHADQNKVWQRRGISIYPPNRGQRRNLKQNVVQDEPGKKTVTF